MPNAFLDTLIQIIRERKNTSPESSYTAKLFSRGTHKIAQKVGEEAVELVIEALSDNDDLFKNEAADLLFHYLILLENRNVDLEEILTILEGRNHEKTRE